MGIIYKLTSPSHKVYIGQTIYTLAHRWMQHKTAANGNARHCVYLEMAIRKYGADNFETKVILECENEKLNHYEKMGIKLYSSNNPKYGYNMTSGGEGFTKITHDGQIMSLSEYHRKRNGNNLPKYIIKTKDPKKSGYCVWKHPLCERKRFTGDPKDDAKSLKRAIQFIKDLEAGKIKPREKLPKYVSYSLARDSYAVQIPIKNGPNIRREFRDKKISKEKRRQMAITFANEQRKKHKL